MELELSADKKKILSRTSIIIFASVMVFLFTIFQRVWPDFKAIDMLSPVPSKAAVLNSVLPKLQKFQNDFNVKKKSSLVESSFAISYASDASAYAVIDYETGDVILEKNLSKDLPIASLTKIITAVVALDLADPGDEITITKKASLEQPTKIGVVLGQNMTVEELLNALLLTSANDAAEALKDGINKKYGVEIFEESMNKKASLIGLENSYFTNPQGYDFGGNHSSAEDLAILTRYALKNYPLIREIVAKDYQFYGATEKHKQFDLYNWNGLLGVYPGVTGVKIGNTGEAGFTTTVVSEREGKKLIAVLLGAPGVLERDLWTAELLDSAFEKSSNLKPVVISEQDLLEKYSTWKYWN